MSHKHVILILGPTAGGKTQLSLELARRLPAGGEIISCDSMQVYRSMDIGTAKPTVEERGTVPHHLLDIVDPNDDSFSVDRWLELADQAITQIRSRNRWPIIVGGTNLYIKAFLEGMLEGPPPNAELRARLERLSPDELRQWLARVDPTAAERIHPNDRKRTIRAIEVFHQTGRQLSEMQTQWSSAGPGSATETTRSDTIIIGLEYPVETINRRINSRVKNMVEAGLVEEVRRLRTANAFGRNSGEALGYKQILEHLEGSCTLEEAIEQIKIRTRRYAKQQRTWLRRFRRYPNSLWINAEATSTQHVADQTLAAIQKFQDGNQQTEDLCSTSPDFTDH